MLTFTFLGVGSAFAKRNFQSNVLVEVWAESARKQPKPDETLLIDFGATGPQALYHLAKRPGFEYLRASENGAVNYPAIHKILITHQHADHIGGLEELALANRFMFPTAVKGKPFKPQIISSINILMNLWDHSLKGGLNTMQGRYALLQDYFYIFSLVPGEVERNHVKLLKRYRAELFPTDHIQIERKYDWPSYGVMLIDSRSGESVFFSGDTRFDYAAYAERMQQAKLIFHDVQLSDDENSVHSTLSELRTLPEEIRKKMLLYHYGDDWDAEKYKLVQQEFLGFAQPMVRMELFG